MKGRDDNGVEDFINSIKKARLRCNQQNLLLDFIIAGKIVENAKRAVRFTSINTYEELYEALRHNLGTNSSVDLARSRLENIKQQNTENVQSYNQRLRQYLNELQYALQAEHFFFLFVASC